MEKKYLLVTVCLFSAIHVSNSFDVQNSTYFDLLLDARNLLTQNTSFPTGPLIDLISSNDFLQFTQVFSQVNLLRSAVQLVSNLTDILTALQSANASRFDNINLQSLLLELPQIQALLGSNPVTANISAAVSAAISDAVAAAGQLDVSSQCLTRTFEVFVGLGSGEQWALRVLDAAGKIPTDLLNFNLDWFGSFDECVAIKSIAFDIQFRGQYCTAEIGLPLPALPGFNPAIEYGLCVPDACTDDDIRTIINFALSLVPMEDSTFAIDTVKCQLNESEYSTKAIGVLCMCGFFVLLMAVATLYDITMIQWPKHKKSNTDLLPSSNGSKKVIAEVEDEKQQNGIPDEIKSQPDDRSHVVPDDKYKVSGEWKFAVIEQPVPEVIAYQPGFLGKILLSFSVYSNGKKLLNTHQGSGSLTALNGIRFLSMTWVVLGHTLALGNKNVKNVTTYFPELVERVSFQAVMNALVSVDTFFALSGLLLTYLIMKEMRKNKGKGGWPRFWFMFYFHRFWRLTPPYMLILGVYVALTPYFYNGPQYQQQGFYLDKDACADTWWTNLLYVNNFVKPKEMCMAWTWYLANDMQFYIVSPLMLLPLFFFPVVGVIVTFVALLATVSVTAVLSRVNKWPPSVYGGGENPIGDVFFDYYIKPYCRMGPYIVGMLTGYLLYRTKCKVNINRYINLLIWAIATTLACLVLYGLYKPLNGEPMNDDVTALYLATHRTVWGACVCWVIFACATGNGGYINTLLSWTAFVPLARLTYCAYLLHPIMIAIYTDGLRVQQYWTDLQVVYLFLAHLVLSYAGAFITSLAFESPMMGMEKVLFGGKSAKK